MPQRPCRGLDVAGNPRNYSRGFGDAVHIRRYWLGTQLSMDADEAEPDGEVLLPHHDADLLQR